MEGYQKLLAWQTAYQLTKEVYILTRHFPMEERFGITPQMRRSAISIPSNLAEGYRRNSRKEWKHFLSIAYGSASELETQLSIAKDVALAPMENFYVAEELLARTLRLINGLTKKIRQENI